MALPEQSSRYLQLLKDSNANEISCYVWLQMVQRKALWKQEGPTQRCLLCNNEYCEKHKSLEQPHTCEINHETYCSSERHKSRHAPLPIFRNTTERNSWVASNGVSLVPEAQQHDEEGNSE
ncbi:hypothetical protein LTR14_012339, partial [Exophiala xenobiotica]